MIFAQRYDVTAQTGVRQPLLTHDFARQAQTLSSMWGPVTTGQYTPSDIAKAAKSVAELFGAGESAALGDVVLHPSVPPIGGCAACLPIWKAARRAADGYSTILVSDDGRRADVPASLTASLARSGPFGWR